MARRFPRPAADTREILGALREQAIATVLRTPGLLALSLALGVATWLFVTEAENPTQAGLFPVRIPVTYVNVGDDLAVANDLGSVALRIEAPVDRWDSLSPSNFEASVDLAGRTAREQSVPVRAEVGGARGVRILAVAPPAISVNLEEVVSRIIPVEPRLVGALPFGYEAGEAVPERLTVEISGPDSLVALARSAVAEINVAGLTVGFGQTVELTPRGEGGGRIRGLVLEPSSVGVEVGVRRAAVTKTVPLAVELLGEPAAGYRVSGVAVRPGVARVEGAIEALRGLDELPLGAVRLDGAAADIRVALAPSLPDGVAAPGGPGEAEVVVTIEPVAGTTVVVVVPEAGGVPDGLAADFGDQVVTVVLDGPLPLLNGLETGDVRAEVDAGGLAPEEAGEAAVRVAAPDGVTVREWRPARLSVTLTPARDEG